MLLRELGTGLGHKDAGLTNGVTYYYTVVAVNSVGPGPSTPEVSVTPWALPSAPTGLIAVVVQGNLVRCTWGAPASDGGFDIAGYRVFRSVSGPSGPFVEVGRPTERSFTDTDVEEGRTYWYRVAALSPKGEGPASATVGITVDGREEVRTAPIPPLLLAIALVVIAAVATILVRRERSKG